jgi:CHASE2 domain-containing sensor protein
MLRSKKFLTNLLLVTSFSIFFLIVLTSLVTNRAWSLFDYYFIDIGYQLSIKLGYAPPKSDRIIYLTITDKTYSEYFQSNYFDRLKFSSLLNKVNEFSPEAICIDLVFHSPTDSFADYNLEQTFSEIENLYLPVSYSLVSKISEFSNQNILDGLLSSTAKSNIQSNGNPFIGENPILQKTEYLEKANRVGHINEVMDDDGVFRHSNLLIKIDTCYLPSLALSTFLGFMNIPTDSIIVSWNNFLKIPALNNSWLNNDIIIAIDERGRTFIPFVQAWGEDFDNISVEKFLQLYNDKSSRTQLWDLLEGRIIILGDISNNISNFASVTVSKNNPIVSILSNSVNGLLLNISYTKWSYFSFIIFIVITYLLLSTSLIFKDQFPFFLMSAVLIIGTLVLSFILLLNYILIPIATILISIIVYIIVLSTNTQSFLFKENKEIEIINLRRNYEFEEARKIQFSMLPKNIPQLQHLEIITYMKTATEVGGDFYDFHVLADQSLLIALGDATDHGLKAGTMVTVVKSLFTELKDRYGHNQILEMMNSTIRKLNLHLLYMSLLLMKIEKDKLTVTSAGMPPILIYDHENDLFKEIIIKSPPPGGFAKITFPMENVSLNDEDLIFLMSDGLQELFNEKKEMLGLDRIKMKLGECIENDINAIKLNIIELVNNWNGNKSPNDDITFIIIRIKNNLKHPKIIESY